MEDSGGGSHHGDLDACRTTNKVEENFIAEPQEQARTVIQQEIKFWTSDHGIGALCYAISTTWWHKWCAFTGFKLDDNQNPIIEVNIVDVKLDQCYARSA